MEEKKPEANKHICKVCKELKNRIEDGYYPNANKKYRGDDGLLWSGKICGICNQKRLKIAMQLKRQKKECGSSQP